MEIQDYLEVISDLNGDIFEADEFCEKYYFHYKTNGSCDLIYFCGHEVYNSEDICAENVEQAKTMILDEVKELRDFLNKTWK